MVRRVVVVGLGASAALGVMARRSRAPVSGPHDSYFSTLNKITRQLGVPAVVVDVDRLKMNAQVIGGQIQKTKLALRLVVKSLPCLGLLDAIAENDPRFMVFNTIMLSALWQRNPASNVLLGKPMPIAAVRALFAQDPARFCQAMASTQWLIDTVRRLSEYETFAKENELALRVSLEIDIGLHRGGFTELAPALQVIKANPQLKLAGLMGYDAHVGKTPGLFQARAFRMSQERFRTAISDVQKSGFDVEQLCLNGAGSMTFKFHLQNGTVANELSMGSAFLSPSEFDQESLVPAFFIAAPVLKRMSPSPIPGLESVDGLRRFVFPETSNGLYVFGGHWLANPVSPPGVRFGSLHGRSSNQEFLMAGPELQLEVGDCVFYRPTQSESVLNSLGDVVAVQAGQLVARWPVLS